MNKISSTILTLSSIAVLQGCGGSDLDLPEPTPVSAPPPATVTIVDTAIASGNFTTLVAALKATGLDATLDNADASFTVFAPTDDAFALLGQKTIDDLLADTETLSDILTYHVASTEINAAAAIAAAGNTLEMVNGDSIGLSLNGDDLLINTATAITTDIHTDNGIIHVIDAVLMPPAERTEPASNIVETAIAAGTFNTLVAALQATGLDTDLADESGDFTVFAPTDDAFAMLGEQMINRLLANPDLLSNILSQHVLNQQVDAVTAYSLNGSDAETLSGAMIPLGINATTDALTFGGANVVSKDIYTSNGVIHVIDMVVIAGVRLPQPPLSIVDIATSAGSFNTLVAALQATGLDTILADMDAQFTVFAPTDAAFALLGEERINALLADPDMLRNILLYHVISDASILQDAAVTAAQSADSKVTMANGQMAALSLSGSTLYLNKSAVSAADVMADNGVIHIVDQVILPPAMKAEPSMSIVDVALADTDFSTLVAALTAADLVTTLADDNATFTVFAPTNAAFAKIPTDVLNGLLSDIPTLTRALLQHVVNDAEISSVDAFAANGASIDTLADEDVSVNLVNYAQAMDMPEHEVTYDAANQRLIGGMGSAQPGFTLYVFDSDLGSGGSVCNDNCAVNWPPVLVTDGEASGIPGLSTITRDDGSLQASYQGRPLYFFINDSAAGDNNGQGVNDIWWQLDQQQVSLQIQGSNVITTDIYTTNGVIHVIDTVITETLE